MLAFLLASANAQELAAIPPLTSHVMDSIGMLNQNQRDALDTVLKDYETRTGSQIAVLLVRSTAPEGIEQYSIRVADTWKLGRKGIDDGVILVVARDNPKALRRLRIEAGRGVQGTLTDAQSKRILQDVIAPHFRQNDFYGGLVAGVSAIASLLDQEKLPKRHDQPASSESLSTDSLLPFILSAFFIAIAFSRMRRSRSAFGHSGWGKTGGIVLGSGVGRGRNSGGRFSGGGGGFDGGGASGDW